MSLLFICSKWYKILGIDMNIKFNSIKQNVVSKLKRIIYRKLKNNASYVPPVIFPFSLNSELGKVVLYVLLSKRLEIKLLKKIES